MNYRLLSSRIAAAASLLACGIALAFTGSSAGAVGWCTNPSPAKAGIVETSDDTPSAQPTLTFKYTVATPRSTQGDMLFYTIVPSGFSMVNKNNADTIAVTTVKVNGVTQSPGIIYTGNGSIYGNAVFDIRIASGYSLAAGDEVEVIIASGVTTNRSSAGTVTWDWRTADPSGNTMECFTATAVYVDPTATTTTTTTTTTVASTTTDAATTTSVAGATTTSVAGATTSVAGATTTVATDDSVTDDGVMAASGAPADEELTSTGKNSDLWLLVAIALVMIGILATNGRLIRDEG